VRIAVLIYNLLFQKASKTVHNRRKTRLMCQVVCFSIMNHSLNTGFPSFGY